MTSTMTDTIVLSIRPRFVEAIFEGTKKFEFRRVMPSNRLLHKVLIYESAPISMVVGEFKVVSFGRCGLSSMWIFCSPYAGITRQEFEEYFHGQRFAQCYIIDSVIKYKKPFSIKELGFKHPPQNFYYVKNNPQFQFD